MTLEPPLEKVYFWYDTPNFTVDGQLAGMEHCWVQGPWHISIRLPTVEEMNASAVLGHMRRTKITHPKKIDIYQINIVRLCLAWERGITWEDELSPFPNADIMLLNHKSEITEFGSHCFKIWKYAVRWLGHAPELFTPPNSIIRATNISDFENVPAHRSDPSIVPNRVIEHNWKMVQKAFQSKTYVPPLYWRWYIDGYIFHGAENYDLAIGCYAIAAEIFIKKKLNKPRRSTKVTAMMKDLKKEMPFLQETTYFQLEKLIGVRGDIFHQGQQKIPSNVRLVQHRTAQFFQLAVEDLINRSSDLAIETYEGPLPGNVKELDPNGDDDEDGKTK